MAIPPAYVYRALRRYASKVGWPVMYVCTGLGHVRTRLPTYALHGGVLSRRAS